MIFLRFVFATFLSAPLIAGIGHPTAAQEGEAVRTGAAAFGNWKDDAPGVRRLIRPEDMPAPGATKPVGNGADVVARPDGVWPIVPQGFDVSLFARGLAGPRTIRVAPNGDIFVAESAGGRIRVFRAAERAGEPSQSSVFAAGFNRPYGIAFYPPGPEPQYIYVAQSNAVIRFPYLSGDLEARERGEVIVGDLPTGGHWTRDIAFSQDGTRMFVSVGSASNVARGMGGLSASKIADHQSRHGLGAAWGAERDRGAVLVFNPDGGEWGAARIIETSV